MFVLFHSYPILSRASQEKTRELVRLLTRHQLRSRLLLVPFGEIQQRVVLAVSPPLRVVIFLSLGLAVMGLTYGPLGTALSELFPTSIRYTGASLTFNLAGIIGASLAPYLATWLATHYGLAYVGYYLTAAGAVTLIALLLIRTPQPQL